MVHRKYMRDTKLNNTVSTLTKYGRSNGGKKKLSHDDRQKGSGRWVMGFMKAEGASKET